ncbi:cell division protease FtsH [Lachnospiraceae bacterium XBB2008]|nr:cell division protease FtsH [Lachnospiraceae bacterium XBB2008]
MSEFDKVIGYSSVKNELIRFCDVIRNSERYEKMGVSLPRGVMLYGEPGIGKTLMAKCFIAEAGCESFTIRKDKADGDFIDHMRESFEKARKADKAIVFLDDMDKFANEDEKHPNAEEYVAVQACIDDCKGYNVFVIATINEKRCLPPSLMRAGRFDKIIDMAMPGTKDTMALVEYFLRNKRLADDLDPNEVGRLLTGHSVAEIEMVLNDAGINAGFETRSEICRDDILKAIVRMVMEAPGIDKYEENSDDIEAILVHELGHVVTAEVQSPGSVDIVSVEPHGGRVGGLISYRTDNCNMTKETLEKKVVRVLGGRAAIEIIYGVPDMGAGDDLRQASRMLYRAITDEAIMGFEALDCLGGYGDENRDIQDRYVARELENCYQKAKKIIAEHRDLLDALADVLMKEKTITFKTIRQVIGAVGLEPTHPCKRTKIT